MSTNKSSVGILCIFSRAVTRPVLILLPVLGLTWLCGVLVHLSVVLAYIFITLNALQVNKLTALIYWFSAAAGSCMTFII